MASTKMRARCGAMIDLFSRLLDDGYYFRRPGPFYTPDEIDNFVIPKTIGEIKDGNDFYYIFHSSFTIDDIPIYRIDKTNAKCTYSLRSNEGGEYLQLLFLL